MQCVKNISVDALVKNVFYAGYLKTCKWNKKGEADIYIYFF